MSDEDYRYMVETHTEIQTHVKIGENGTVEQGPWNEESLPPETLLYTSVVAPPVLAEKVRTKLNKHEPLDLLEKALADAPLVRLGGDRSLGKGLAMVKVLK